MGNKVYGAGLHRGYRKGLYEGAFAGYLDGNSRGYKKGVLDTIFITTTGVGAVCLAYGAKKHHDKKIYGNSDTYLICSCCGSSNTKKYISKKGNEKIKCKCCGNKEKI